MSMDEGFVSEFDSLPSHKDQRVYVGVHEDVFVKILPNCTGTLRIYNYDGRLVAVVHLDDMSMRTIPMEPGAEPYIAR